MKLCRSRTLHKSLSLSQTNQVAVHHSSMWICVELLLIVFTMQFDHLNRIHSEFNANDHDHIFLVILFNSARFIVVATNIHIFAVSNGRKYWQTRHPVCWNWIILITDHQYTMHSLHLSGWTPTSANDFVIHITVFLLKSAYFFSAIFVRELPQHGYSKHAQIILRQLCSHRLFLVNVTRDKKILIDSLNVMNRNISFKTFELFE